MYSINEYISMNIHPYKCTYALCDNDIHTLQNGRKKGVILHITVVVATILIFYDDKNIDSK